MAGIALKSCTMFMKQENGLTATGRESTKTTNLKGANQAASADTVVGVLAGLASLTGHEVLSYGRKDAMLVSDEL